MTMTNTSWRGVHTLGLTHSKRYFQSVHTVSPQHGLVIMLQPVRRQPSTANDQRLQGGKDGANPPRPRYRIA